eukprot:TRINITY_DN67351_c0_g1_i1.p1 TRINITY_DN67351_c0_g1~~TRINITY_DN67351_c0_g1_i1.p1  ORF type:complete len:269 (-),score=44.63 TRINITY_DN67351_c0_g1_i1:119-925(-)
MASSGNGILKLHYMELRARAEPLRMILHHAGMPFEDILYSVEAWKTAKPTMPEGKGVAGVASRPPGNRALPVLELESGEMVSETSDIALLIAQRAGDILLPADEAKFAEAQEMWVSTNNFPLYFVQPMLSSYTQEQAEAILRREKPEGTVHGNIADLPFTYDEVLPAFQAWQARLRGEFYGGDAPHYGDFALYHAFDSLRHLEPEVAATLDGLVAWAARLETLPAMKAYLAERPPLGMGSEPGPGCTGRPGSIYAKWAEPSLRGDREM